MAYLKSKADGFIYRLSAMSYQPFRIARNFYFWFYQTLIATDAKWFNHEPPGKETTTTDLFDLICLTEISLIGAKAP